MKCPYCNQEMYNSDGNYQGMDVYECIGDNRTFRVPTGSPQVVINRLALGEADQGEPGGDNSQSWYDYKNDQEADRKQKNRLRKA